MNKYLPKFPGNPVVVPNNTNTNNSGSNSSGNTTPTPGKIILGSDSRGTVELLGAYGNKNSNRKIAYVIGVHPLESLAHNSLYNTIISKSNSLNYCYYIYKINVTSYPNDYDKGRMNG